LVSAELKILIRSFVKSFFTENAPLFVFGFTIMFCIIGKVDGAGLYAYHYSLVSGMLKSNVFLFIVFLIWLIYVRKYCAFVSAIIKNEQFSFLHIYNQLSKAKRLKLFLLIHVCLLMPVLLYTAFIFFAGISQHMFLPLFFISVYLLLLLILPAVWHVHQLDNLHQKKTFSPHILKSKNIAAYHFILFRFILKKQTIIWLGIKIFTCGLVYLIARNNNPNDYDITMSLLFYIFGILANTILIFKIRTFEDAHLSFYKGLPVSLAKRYAQYLLLYFLLLIPEFIIISLLIPQHFTPKDGVGLMLFGFGLLLLINAITFLTDLKLREYVKMLFFIFCFVWLAIVSAGIIFLCVFLFIISAIIFYIYYYTAERDNSVKSQQEIF